MTVKFVLEIQGGLIVSARATSHDVDCYVVDHDVQDEDEMLTEEELETIKTITIPMYVTSGGVRK